MSDSNSIFCPQCQQKTSLAKRVAYQWPKDTTITFEISECNGCDFFVMVKRNGNSIAKIYPDPLPKPIHASTPDFLITDLREANQCFAVGAYRATGVMARRALQSCCIEKGAPDKKLQDQIDWMLDQQIITKDLKEWAHEVRLTGNDSAHPSKSIGQDTSVSADDAEDILMLLEKFIDVLYIAPALAKERRQRRDDVNS